MFRKVLAAGAALGAVAVIAVGPADAAHLITGSQIKNSSITGADVRSSSLTGSDVKSGSITGSDVKNESLTAADFNGSVKGDTGAPGPQGPQGPAGPTTVNALNRVEGPVVTVAAAKSGSSTATCPSGQTVVSGGYTSAVKEGEVFGNDSYGATDAWIALLDNFDSATTGTVQAFAYCAPTGQAISPRAAAKGRSAADAAVAAAIEAQEATH